jgi:origin recognition complex subunit 5
MDYFQHIEESLVRSASEKFPGHDTFTAHLTTLLTTCPPPCIYIHDPHTVRTTSRLLRHVLSALSAFEPPDFSNPSAASRVRFAQIDAVSCFVSRLFYDSALNQLARWSPSWEDGCENWSDGSGMRFNDSLDGFIHGIQALDEQLQKPAAAAKDRKGKGKAKVSTEGNGQVRMVLVVERAERMKDVLYDLVVPLTRLAELVSCLATACMHVLTRYQSRVDVTTIFLSEVAWEGIKPSKGAAVEPYRMLISPPAREGALPSVADTSEH